MKYVLYINNPIYWCNSMIVSVVFEPLCVTWHDLVEDYMIQWTVMQAPMKINYHRLQTGMKATDIADNASFPVPAIIWNHVLFVFKLRLCNINRLVYNDLK